MNFDSEISRVNLIICNVMLVVALVKEIALKCLNIGTT